MSEDEIRHIIAGAVPFQKGDSRLLPDPIQPAPMGPTVRITSGSELEPEEVRWLWREWLAINKLNLLAGAAGTGKTTIALTLAATLTTGGRAGGGGAGGCWPDGSAAEAGDVLVWSGEDDVRDTLFPRFLASGGDRHRIHFVEAATDRGRERAFDPATDMPALAEAARGIADLKLLILDPVVSAVSGDSHKNSETRRGLQPVVDFAQKLDCAVLGITHLAKNSSGRDPLDRVAGSLAFGAVPRLVMSTVKPPDSRAPRRLLRTKATNGRDNGGFEYTLRQAPVPGHAFTAQRADWGPPLDGSAHELMAIERSDSATTVADEAEAFLRDALREGPMATKDLKEAAEANGHNWRAVEQAKKTLGVVAVKPGYQKPWLWQLPAPKAAADAKDRDHTDLLRPLDSDR